MHTCIQAGIHTGRTHIDTHTHRHTASQTGRLTYGQRQTKCIKSNREYIHTCMQTDKHTDIHTDSQTVRQRDRQTRRQADRQTDRQADTNRHTYSQTARQIRILTNRQTDRETDTQIGQADRLPGWQARIHAVMQNNDTCDFFGG